MAIIYLPMTNKVRTKINTNTGDVFKMDKSLARPWKWVKCDQTKGRLGNVGEIRFARAKTSNCNNDMGIYESHYL